MRKRKRKQVDPKEKLITLARQWASGDTKAREEAEPIFQKYPELRNEREFKMELALYIQWHKFIASFYEQELTAAFEKWKSGKKQEDAEQANELWLELTGQEIPTVPLFGEDDSYEEFWETGVRYDEKLQKIREEQEKKFE